MRFRFEHSAGLLAAALILMVLAGCDRQATSALPPAPIQWDDSGDEHAVHVHPAEGPHHGTLIELGKGRYHAELILDPKTHGVGVYFLDQNARNPVAVGEQELTIYLLVQEKPAEFKLPAVERELDSAGRSAHFAGINEVLFNALQDPHTTGRFNVTIERKPFFGQLEGHQPSHPHEHEHTVTARPAKLPR